MNNVFRLGNSVHDRNPYTSKVIVFTNRPNMNKIPFFLFYSAYSTCRAVAHIA